MKKQSGFTLIELVMVIVILGILAASFAPKFVNLSTDARDAARAAATGAVKSAHTILLAKNKGQYSNVTALAAQTDGGTAVATGIEFDTDNDAVADYTVATLKESAPGVCNAATTLTTDLVCGF